jgi:hypothetical protein
MSGARKRTRTSKAVRPLEPESSASASSAIRAHAESIICRLLARCCILSVANCHQFPRFRVSLLRRSHRSGSLCRNGRTPSALFVTTNFHRNILGNACTSHISNNGSREIVPENLHTNSSTHVIPRNPKIQPWRRFPCEDQSSEALALRAVNSNWHSDTGADHHCFAYVCFSV